jgi:hypothetical protein
MEKYRLGKKILSQLLVMSFILTSCMPADMPSSKLAQNSGNLGSTTNGSGAGTGDGTGTTETSILPKVEVRHLIEPNLSTDTSYSTGTGYAGGGSYVRKLTIPKNFAGRLYVAGINIGSLVSRFVKVRFKFGVGKEIVTIPGTVAKAPGITPSTDISVLVLDLRSEPFRNIRLSYDLYDYNEYAAGEEPVQDNRNSGLYCRGLRLEDDPTFVGVGACDQTDEECLYAYAKVLDQGLVKQSGSVKVPLTPSFPQIKSVTGSNYFQDYMSQKLLKPLPDTMPTSSTNVAGSFRFSDLASPAGSSDSVSIVFNDWSAKTFLGSNYYYRGPYRVVNSTEWQFKFPELDGPKRLFKKDSWVAYDPSIGGPLPDDNQTIPNQYRLYYNSYMFPLATKLDLTANVTHLASNAVDGVRTEQSLSVAGKTVWMDGSNARAQSRNYDLEHIGSCNVSATIEILAQDDNGNEYIVSTANDVKLQLVRPTQYRTDTGNEVLYTNFKSCTNNAGCGGSECCFNNRCWDNSLVSQCMDSNSTGNRIIGETCSTDLECSSLCCNKTSGQCAPHNTVLSPAVLCSKPIGDSCIAKEWCQKSTVRKCYIVKTGTESSTGKTTCNQICYDVQEYGECTNGTCTPPVQETYAPFDPSADGACTNAVPAPNF